MPEPQWPHLSLDFARQRSTGWRPAPFREFVLKVHQRCNLACDYCYVYELADQSWRDRPPAMSPAVWRAAAARIAEHVTTHRLGTVTVVLHGGEPLLAGIGPLAALIADIRSAVDGRCRIRFGMQTNGVLLTARMLDMLHTNGVRIGISLDGTAAAHDRHRRHRGGSGSAAAVHRAVHLVRTNHPESFAGLLCTVDPAADPVETFDALAALRPPMIDFLLPHANWSAPPGRPIEEYGNWLCAAFDRRHDTGDDTPVRLFDDIVRMLFGRAGRSEQIGLSPAALVVVESDGAIEQVDALKSAYPGAAGTGLTVQHHSFDAALAHPGVIARQIGLDALAETCRACPVHAVCGGGHYAHRYAKAGGFRHPSVYSAALRHVIEHVRDRIHADLASLRPGGIG